MTRSGLPDSVLRPGVVVDSIQSHEVVKMGGFLQGAQLHTDGLAGYVEGFLQKHDGSVNEYGRPWTVESCADALDMPARTLRRYLANIGADLQEPTAVLPTAKAQQVKQSHARSALTDPEQRREVIEALPPEVRDELRADLIAADLPHMSGRCIHCPNHCPEGGKA